MPSSSKKKHTSSATKQASTAHLKSRMSRATSLETSLSTATNEEARSSLRIQLCEVFSEVILENAEYALKKDVYGRLWRTCFYARIGELRSRMSKAKKKQDSSTFQATEATLKTFLKEGIALYKYLIERYESVLLPQDSQDSAILMEPSVSVVAGLHRLYIFLGDLYRYSHAHGKAEECYTQASKLAPAKGNPYNQLAVVAQLKDANAPLSCVAFYYYARSLLASHDPFPTSRSNLERLLESNREWLQTTSEAELLESSTTTYAEKVAKARAQKSIASRFFLARLVDVHYDFFRALSFTERQARDVELCNSMNVLFVKLDALLKDWAFGDALLLKMVCISAFSIETTKNKTLARAFLLKFGAALAQRLEISLKKAMEKQTTTTTSLRLLTPLLILSDYVSTWILQHDSLNKALTTEAREFSVEASQQYWTRLASVATRLVPFRNSLGLDEMDEMPQLEEYKALQGFKPFESITGGASDESQVYLSPEAAGQVLASSSSSQKQQSSSPQQVNAAKLKRFFAVVDTMVDKKQPICCVNGQYRVFFKQTTSEEVDAIVESSEEEEDGDNVCMMEEASPIIKTEKQVPRVPLDNVQEEVMLEYKQSEGGPALLVPGALLLGKTSSSPTAASAKQDKAPAVAPKQDYPTQATVPMETTPTATALELLEQQALSKPVALEAHPVAPLASTPAVALKAPPLGPPPGLLPPPGFGAPTSTAAAPPSFPPPQQEQPTPMAFGFDIYPPPPPSSNSNQPSLPDGDTVLQMLRGMDTNTSNPFMTSSAVDSLFQTPANNNEDVDGMSLLDSSLLSSMMMDDSNSSQRQSRNPFLT